MNMWKEGDGGDENRKMLVMLASCCWADDQSCHSQLVDNGWTTNARFSIGSESDPEHPDVVGRRLSSAIDS
jgi:hypothetical protein